MLCSELSGEGFFFCFFFKVLLTLAAGWNKSPLVKKFLLKLCGVQNTDSVLAKSQEYYRHAQSLLGLLESWMAGLKTLYQTFISRRTKPISQRPLWKDERGQNFLFKNESLHWAGTDGLFLLRNVGTYSIGKWIFSRPGEQPSFIFRYQTNLNYATRNVC